MNDIQDKVMQANGINQNKVPGRQLKEIQDLIKREKRKFVTTKLLTGFFWIASLIILGFYMFFVKSLLHSQRGGIAEESVNSAIMALESALPLTIVIAAVCSVLLYIRAKSVNLLQVHERLQNLEEMVKVLLSK